MFTINNLKRHIIFVFGLCLVSYGCSSTGQQTISKSDQEISTLKDVGANVDEKSFVDSYSIIQVDGKSKESAAKATNEKSDVAAIEDESSLKTASKFSLENRECGTLDSLPKTIKFVGSGVFNRERAKFVDSKGALVVTVEVSQRNTNKYYMVNSENKVVIVGIKTSKSSGQFIEIYDCNENRLGSIKQDVEKSFLSAEASYQALGADGEVLFQTEKQNENSPVISITGRQNEKVAALKVERNRKNYEAVLTTQIEQTQQLLMLATLKVYSESNN